MSKEKISVLTWIAIVLTIIAIVSGSCLYYIVHKGYLPCCLFQPVLLVCTIGLISYCLSGFLFGIGGLFVEIKRKNYKGIIICIICLLIYLISISVMRESSRRMACASNIRNIKFALQQYATDYSGYFPPENGAAGLEYLRKYDYLTDYSAYTCPSTKTARGKANQPLTEETVDYVYAGGLTDKSGPNLPVLYDKPGNHKSVCNVIISDAKYIYEKNWLEDIYGKDLMEKIKK